MSDFAANEMNKHRTALRQLAASHGPTSGPVYLTGVLVGLSYSLNTPATGPVSRADIEALAQQVQALLDTAKPG